MAPTRDAARPENDACNACEWRGVTRVKRPIQPEHDEQARMPQEGFKEGPRGTMRLQRGMSVNCRGYMNSIGCPLAQVLNQPGLDKREILS